MPMGYAGMTNTLWYECFKVFRFQNFKVSRFGGFKGFEDLRIQDFNT
jgi:hypothetical protein